MQQLAQALIEEQPRINAVLDREVAALPALVRPVAAHVLGAGGKRLRPLLAILMARVFGGQSDDIYSLACAVELFHVATLLHDDILDCAAIRRGSAAAHTVFGPVPTTLAGDALLATAAHMVARQGDARLTACFAEAIVHTTAGELAEFTHQGDIALPHAVYLEIITGKTAWALRASCELAALRLGASEEEVAAAAAFGQELGIAFQMVDDALDIAPEKETGKPAGGDLRERKCTPLSRFYWEGLSPAEAAGFAERFAKGAFSDAELSGIIAKMKEQGLDERTRVLAEEHLARAQQALSRLPEGPGRDLLALMPEYVRTRNR